MNKGKERSALNYAGQQIMNSTPRETANDLKKGNILEFEQRIEDLKNEIEQKDITIGALQRNYEGISLIYKEEKGRSLEWADKIAAMDRENSVLRGQIQTTELKRSKIEKDLAKAQEELQKLFKITEENRANRLESQTKGVLYEKKVPVI